MDARRVRKDVRGPQGRGTITNTVLEQVEYGEIKITIILVNIEIPIIQTIFF